MYSLFVSTTTLSFLFCVFVFVHTSHWYAWHQSGVIRHKDSRQRVRSERDQCALNQPTTPTTTTHSPKFCSLLKLSRGILQKCAESAPKCAELQKCAEQLCGKCTRNAAEAWEVLHYFVLSHAKCQNNFRRSNSAIAAKCYKTKPPKSKIEGMRHNRNTVSQGGLLRV